MKRPLAILMTMALLGCVVLSTACRRKYLEKPVEVYVPGEKPKTDTESTDTRGHYVVDETVPAEQADPQKKKEY
ncbi:MAG: hypothetical protein PWP23_620 [Candidatus Sumerlaeota bacterium]|nr:hypothetical protein [Candidatus Sumerlaeota bacterium]